MSRSPSGPRPMRRWVIALVALSLLATSQVSMHTSKAEAATALPTVDFVSRTTSGQNHLVGSLLWSPSIGFAAGPVHGSVSVAKTGLPTDCDAYVWLVPLDRTTLSAGVVDPGLIPPISACLPASDPGSVASTAKKLATSTGTPLVVVNTLSVPNCTSMIDSHLGEDLSPLGFGDAGSLDNLNLCVSTLTGLGSGLLPAGQAWQSGGLTSYDYIANVAPGTQATVNVAIKGRLVPTTDNQYHLINNDAKVARRYGGDGAGGWDIDGTKYPFDPYAGGGSIPPDLKGGFQIVTASSFQASSTFTLVRNKTYWTNTGNGTNDDAAWTSLTNDFLADEAHRDYVVLIRNVGSASGLTGPPTSGTYGGVRFGAALARYGGIKDVVITLTVHRNVTMVFPGGLPADLPAIKRTVMPTFLGNDVTPGQDSRYTNVLLTRSHLGGWFQPALVQAGVSDTDEPFAFQKMLAKPATAWPYQDAAHLAAFAAWSNILCSCSDARTKFVDGSTGTWAGALLPSVTPNQSGAGYTATDFDLVRNELSKELGAANNVRVMYNHVFALNDQIAGSKGLGLIGAWDQVLRAMAQDDAWAKSDQNAIHVIYGIVELLGLIGELIPGPVGTAISVGVGIWFGVLEWVESARDDPDTKVSSEIANLGTAMTKKIEDDVTDLGVAFREIFTDYGRLMAVSAAMSNGAPGWVWDPVAEQASVLALAKAAKAGLYRELVPSVYELIEVHNDGGRDELWNPAYALSGPSNNSPKGDDRFYKYYYGKADTPGSMWPSLDALPDPGHSYDQHIAVIGRTPMFTSNVSNPLPIPKSLTDDIFAQGVWQPVMFRTWPFPTTTCDWNRWHNPEGCYLASH